MVQRCDTSPDEMQSVRVQALRISQGIGHFDANRLLAASKTKQGRKQATNRVEQADCERRGGDSKD